MDTLLQDLKYAVRQLAQRPGFTAVVVLTLAVGIGANTAMFSVLSAVLFRPAPVAGSDRLVWIAAQHGQSGVPQGISYPDFVDVRSHARQLDGVIAYSHLWLSLGGGVPERIRGEVVTANYFDLLGVRPAQGRTFRLDEEEAGGPHDVTVLSNGFWRRHFSGDPDVLGRTVVVNGSPFTLIGVAPPGFEGIEISDDAPVALWLTLGAMPEAAPEAKGFLTDRFSSGWIRTVGRLAPGASLASAGAELTALGEGMRPASADQQDRFTLMTMPVQGGLDPSNRREVLPVLSLLMLVPLLVLVVACANAANVLLSRGLARRKELAVRRALGATRPRLVRQLLTESLVLALLAAGTGVLLSFLLTQLVAGIGDIPAGIVAAFTPDRQVLLATTLVAITVGLLFGLVPALAATRLPLSPSLKTEGISFGPRGERHRLRDGLVVAQITVALVLIVTAELFTNSLYKAVTADPGFAARQGLYISFDLARQRYDSTRQATFRREVLRTVGALPSVATAALASTVPFGGRFEGTSITPQDVSDQEEAFSYLSSVSPRFLDALGVPLIEGRAFTDHDDAASPGVVIVNEYLARRLWPGRAALGRHVRIGAGDVREVVGVTRTGKYANLYESATPQAYIPLAQHASPALVLVVRTAADPARLVPRVRAAAQALDPDLPLFGITTFEAAIRRGADKQRASAAALAVFGTLALLLTLVGIYGVTAHGVALRTREIGIRVSLGARAADVLGLFVGEGLKRAVVGIALGTAISVVLSRVLARFLFGFSPTDAVSFFVGALVIVGGVTLASGVPARRAAAVDPVVALRTE